MALEMNIEEVKALTVDEIKKVSNLKCIATVFGNGPHGRKVETSEMKGMSGPEREDLGAACRQDLVVASQV